jgi:hypothetical protein
LVRDGAFPRVIGISIKKVAGKGDFVAQFSSSNFTDRLAEGLPLHVETGELDSREAKNVAE